MRVLRVHREQQPFSMFFLAGNGSGNGAWKHLGGPDARRVFVLLGGCCVVAVAGWVLVCAVSEYGRDFAEGVS